MFRLKSTPPNVRTLVAALPDMGNVAGIAMGHLIKKLEMEVFAEVEGDWPPYVVHQASRVIFERGWFKFYGRDGLKFVAMTGTYQPPDPHSLYKLCEGVLDLAQEIGIERVFTLGAAHTTDEEIDEPRVFYATTSDVLAERVSAAGAVPLSSEGYITGFNGLLLGLAKERGIDGICLLGEINDPHVRQAHAAKAVLQVLTRVLGEEIGYEELDEEIERVKAAKRLNRMLRRHDRPPGVM